MAQRCSSFVGHAAPTFVCEGSGGPETWRDLVGSWGLGMFMYIYIFFFMYNIYFDEWEKNLGSFQNVFDELCLGICLMNSAGP